MFRLLPPACVTRARLPLTVHVHRHNSCAGYRIAVTEMVLAVGNLVRCFDVEAAGPLDLYPKMQLVWHPREDVRVRFTPRAAAAALQDAAAASASL